MTVHNFQLYLGHAESESLACIMFQHTKGVESAWEGLRSIAQVLTLFLKDQAKQSESLCCQMADPAANFCPKCGSNLSDLEIDDLDFYFEELFSARNNDVQCWEYFEQAGWELAPVAFDINTDIVIVHKAGQMIVSAAENEKPHEYDLPFLSTVREIREGLR